MDSQKQPPAYSQTKDELFSNLETSSAGLSEPEVDRRLKKYGHNVLNEKPPKSILNMLKEQIFDPMILILLGAASFSALLNEWVEASVIFFIVIIISASSSYICYCAGVFFISLSGLLIAPSADPECQWQAHCPRRFLPDE